MTDNVVTFTFSDTNPLTGKAYGLSRFEVLPRFVAAVVTGTLHMEAGEWDSLIFDGEAFEFTGDTDAYPIPGAVRRGSEVVMPPELLAPAGPVEDITAVIG